MKFKNFGIRLAQAIEASGLTQSEVAKKLSTSPSLVSRWKNEEILPGMANAKKLSQLLKVEIEWLLTGEEQVYTEETEVERLHETTTTEGEERMFLKQLMSAQEKIIELLEENAALKEELLKKPIPLLKKEA